MTLTIRPITPTDQDAWRVLWTAYLEFYDTSVSEQVYQTTFARICDTVRVHQNGFLAIKNDLPVGLVHFVYHAHNWRTDDVCYLQDLFADPEARGTGVGRALIEAVYARADIDGVPSVYWMTQDFNTTARQLYDRIGTVTPFIKYTRPPQ